MSLLGQRGLLAWLRRIEDSMLDEWKQFHLTEEEQNDISQESIFSKKIRRREKLSLLGFVVSKKPINKKAFKSTIQGVWRTKGKVDFKEVRYNLFIIEFRETLNLKGFRKKDLGHSI